MKKFIRKVVPFNDEDKTIDYLSFRYGFTYYQLPYANPVGDPYYIISGDEKNIINFLNTEYNQEINEFPTFKLEV